MLRFRLRQLDKEERQKRVRNSLSAYFLAAWMILRFSRSVFMRRHVHDGYGYGRTGATMIITVVTYFDEIRKLL